MKIVILKLNHKAYDQFYSFERGVAFTCTMSFCSPPLPFSSSSSSLFFSCCYFLVQAQSLLLQYQVYTDGNPYGIAEGIVFSVPCRSKVSASIVFFILFNFKVVFVPFIIKNFIL